MAVQGMDAPGGTLLDLPCKRWPSVRGPIRADFRPQRCTPEI